MRRLLHAFLALAIIFSPITPLFADEPQSPSNPNEDQGDFVSLDRMQQGQTQTQNNLARAATLQNQMAAQAASPEVSFDQRPTYSAQIGVNDGFSARFQLTNNSPVIRNGYVMIGFTPSGTANTREFYRPITMPPGTTLRDIVITNAQLRAGGVTPGNYQLSFLAYNEQDQKIGSGFFGNPFSFGSAVPAVGSAPSYSPQINPGQDLVSTWTVGNTGDTTATITLLTVVTPAGTTNFQEFYRTGVAVPAGGGNPPMTVTAAQLSAAGFGAGRYILSFVAFDSAERRIGEFFGKPLTIGDIQVGLPTIPVLPSAIGSTDDLTTQFTFVNSGDTADRVTALLVLTPVGATDPSQSKEFYITQRVAPPGSSTHTVTVTAAQLAAAGIGFGDWIVTATAFDGVERRLQDYFGNLLRIGESSLTVPAAPLYSDRIGSSEDFTAQWTFGNSGPVSADVQVLTVFTKLGTSNSIEIYRDGLVPANGGGTVNVLLTAADRAAAGITAGDYTVSFVAFDANGNRIGEFFGNPLFIGESQATFSAMPEYTGQLLEGRNFESDWTLGNTGPVSGTVTLATSITPAGLTQAVEFNRNVDVAPGGGSFHLEITVAKLQAAGIVPGSYTVSFVAVDAAGNRLGEFLGNTLEVIPAGTPIGFLLGQQLTSGVRSGLVESWEVPVGDPNESLLADRACSYDQAIAAISLLFSGQNATARNILDAMALLEAGTGRVGAMYSVGPQAADFSAVYTGANAWFGDALATYELVTGDARFRPMAERIAETLLSFRDPSTGLLRGGLDADGNAFPWISTEHNLDAYSFLDDLAFVTGDSRWRQAADDLSAAIDTHLWSVSHFLNGFGDDLVSLDSQAYGGIYWLSRGDIARADIVRTFIEENLKTTVDINGTPVTGYAPYRGDSFIWVEGTAVVGILDSFLGRFDSARAIAAAIELFRAASGGLGYASSTQHTSTSGADELFPSFANVASTGWGLILQAILEATPASSSAPTVSTQSSTPVISPSVSSLSNSAVFLPPTQGETKAPMSLYSQAAQQGFFNIAPGMFRLAWLSSGKRSELSQDSFFSFLLEFLFG